MRAASSGKRIDTSENGLTLHHVIAGCRHVKRDQVLESQTNTFVPAIRKPCELFVLFGGARSARDRVGEKGQPFPAIITHGNSRRRHEQHHAVKSSMGSGRGKVLPSSARELRRNLGCQPNRHARGDARGDEQPARLVKTHVLSLLLLVFGSLSELYKAKAAEHASGGSPVQSPHRLGVSVRACSRERNLVSRVTKCNIAEKARTELLSSHFGRCLRGTRHAPLSQPLPRAAGDGSRECREHRMSLGDAMWI